MFVKKSFKNDVSEKFPAIFNYTLKCIDHFYFDTGNAVKLLGLMVMWMVPEKHKFDFFWPYFSPFI